MPSEILKIIASMNRRILIPLVRHLKRLSLRAEADPERVLDGILDLAQTYHHWQGMLGERMAYMEAERRLLEGFADAARWDDAAMPYAARVRGQALQQWRDAQGFLLRSQLSPHFFLNALNAMAGLLEEDPSSAARGLDDLAEVYRKLLALSRKEKAPLVEERRLMERYLGVEKLRLEDSLQTTWQWDRELDGILTPPFLLYPLVENAIRQGVSESASGGQLVISARRQSGGMVLEASHTDRINAGPCGSFCRKAPGAFERSPGANFGILYVKQSLELAYGKSARLELWEEGSWTRSTIFITAAPTSGTVA